MNIPRNMILGTVIGSTTLFGGFAAIGAVAGTPQEQPVKIVERTVEPAPDGNAPEADWRDYRSPHKDDSPNSERPQRDSAPEQQQRNDAPASEDRTEKVDAPASDPASAKPECDQKAEDGSCVGPDFYDRTDYNRNGITDQEEPGWNNGAGEDAFKAEGAASFREWCNQQPSTHECRN